MTMLNVLELEVDFLHDTYRRSTIISFIIELELAEVEEDAMITYIINLFTGLQ